MAARFGKRHDAPAKLFKPESREMALERLAHYLAPAAAGVPADFVQHALQVLIEPESHDIPLHISQCNTGQVAFFQLRHRIVIERRERSSSRHLVARWNSESSDGFS